MYAIRSYYADWSFSNATYTRAKGQVPFEMRMGSGPMYKIYACKGGFVRLVILSPSYNFV